MNKKNINILVIIVSVIIAELAGVIGSVFTSSAIPTWYAALNKPDFSPPNYLFGPVWVLLYALMGISAAIIWNKRKQIGAKFALIVYGFQLILNALWSIIFFGQHNIGLAFIEIVIMWFAIAATMILFIRYSKVAAWILLPYLLWVSFASVLNYGLWMLN